MTGGDWLLLCLATAILILFRVHAFDAPLEVDECNYAYIGQRIAVGDQFYIDVWDHQPPGMFWFSAALVRVFGSGERVFRISATVAALATMILIYGICRKGMGRCGASFAAVVFAVVSSDPGVAGEGCNREIYMNLLGVAAVFLLLLREKRWAILAAGVCLGLASLLKTVVVTQWLMLALGLVAIELLTGKRKRVLLIRDLTLLASGAGLVWMVTVAYLRSTNRLDAFVDAVFVYNLGYGRMDAPIFQKLVGFFAQGGSIRLDVFRSAAPIWVLGAAGFLVLAGRKKSGFAVLVLAYAWGSFLAVCLPGRFWNHYYMLMIPVLVIAAAQVVDSASSVASRGAMIGSTRTGRLAVGFAVAVVLALGFFQWAYYLSLTPDQIARFRYHGRMVWAREHGRRVARVTDPADTIYVAGLDAGMYYYSGRRCASRYTMITHLAGKDQSAVLRRENLAHDLSRNRPRLILLIAGKNMPFIPQLDQYIRENGFIKVGEDPNRMIVLCDPKRPVAPIDWRSQPSSPPP